MRLAQRLRGRLTKAAIGGTAIAAVLTTFAAPQAMAYGGSATDWLYKGKYGVMLHYLAEGCPPGCRYGSYATGVWPTVAEWNTRVDNFDVPGLVQQLQTVKAGWVQVSVGQISGYYAAPNPVYESLVPPTQSHPSRLSHRDLIKDLGQALLGTGIKLSVYVPCDAPRYDTYATSRLGGNIGSPTFEQNWPKVIKQWSGQWGTLVSSWWIDGATCGDSFSNAVIDATRFGNPGALVALNAADWNPSQVPNAGGKTDYVPGERENWNPTSRFVNRFGVSQMQNHVLAVAQGFWGNPPTAGMSYSASETANRTVRINSVGGAITWDVGYDRANGHISAASMNQLAAVRDAAGSVIDDNNPAASYTGSWITVDPGGLYAGTGHHTTSPGSAAQHTFAGTSVAWHSVKGSDQGSADVYIDDDFDRTVNLQQPNRIVDVPVYTKTGLAPGTHTIRVVSRSTKWVTVDRFTHGQAMPVSGIVDDSNPGFNYAGSWLASNPGGCYAGTCHHSSMTRLSAQYTFDGSSVTWHSIKGSDQGSADVYIDGALSGTVDLTQPTRVTDTPVYTRSGLTPGLHTIRIVTRNTAWVAVDRLVIS